MADQYDLQDIHDTLISIAHKAGDMMRAAHQGTTTTVGEKKNSADLVTETDQAVEKMVSTILREKYPTFSFMGEETYKPGDRLGPEPTFICDPIDGTTNFIHRFREVCISLGLSINLEPVVGVVYNPFSDTLWSGIKGKGSYRNLKDKLPLFPTPPMKDLSGCLVAVEWGSERQGNDFNCRANTFKNLCAKQEDGGGMVRGIRCMGSAALNLCEVASGSMDLYWEGGCWAWDVCAGFLILQEAGGIYVDGNPGNWKPRIDERRHLAVRAGEGQKAIVEEFWSKIVGKLQVGL